MALETERAAPGKGRPDDVTVLLDGEPHEYMSQPPQPASLHFRTALDGDHRSDAVEVAK
jgi:hypothetical protein